MSGEELKLKTLKPLIKVTGLCSLAFLFSCATPVEVQLPANRFLTPRTSGKFLAGEASLGAGPSTRYVVVKDINTTPPNSTTEIGAGSVLSAFSTYFALGLMDWMDIYFPNGNAGLKAQILGDASTPGWQMSLAGSAGSKTYDLNSSNSSGSGSSTNSAKSKLNLTDAGFSLGYRTTGNATPYFSYSKKDFKADTTVTQAGGTYNYSAAGSQTTASLGFMKEAGAFVFIFEFVGVEGSLTNATNGQTNGYGISIGYHW